MSKIRKEDINHELLKDFESEFKDDHLLNLNISNIEKLPLTPLTSLHVKDTLKKNRNKSNDYEINKNYLDPKIDKNNN
jgi:hypothetical protein